MNKAQVLSKQQAIQAILAKKNVDAMVVTSFDRYLNEYVPLADCHRHDVTGFTGSVAEALLPTTGKAYLYVDGRYHEQADKECDSSLVEVVKCPYGVSNLEALEQTIIQNGYKRIAIEGERMGVGPWRRLCEICEVVVLGANDFSEVGFGAAPVQGQMKSIDESLCGESVQSKLNRLCRNGEGHFIPSLDSVAWLSNTRGYQLPYQATSRVQAFATKDELILIPDTNADISDEVKKEFKIVSDISKLPLKAVSKIIVYPQVTSVADFVALQSFGIALEERVETITKLHADKNTVEVAMMEDSFARGDKAILKTLKWLKEAVTKNAVTEQQWNDKTSEHYRELGALGQSFKTISGFGANSSIIHYGTPSKEKTWQEGELALLDSGAFFESGLATDTTRTILPSGIASAKHKEVYTLVLKGLLQAQNAIFPEGTRGQAIDSLARAPMRRFGYDYAHGTGHGVGINVHEGCFSLTPLSQVPLVAGRVGSIEPGIYLPNFGGVRLENIVVVEKHPTFKGMLKFRPLVWIGFEPALIDEALLNQEELKWLNDYESECLARGTSFRI